MNLRISGFAVAIAAVLAAGCNSGGGEATTSNAPAPATKTGGASGKPITITLIAKSSTNPVFLSARQGADAAAKELSDKGTPVKIDWRTPAKEDGQVQAQNIQQAVNGGSDAILISCSDAGKVTGAINDAVDKGVQVMT